MPRGDGISDVSQLFEPFARSRFYNTTASGQQLLDLDLVPRSAAFIEILLRASKPSIGSEASADGPLGVRDTAAPILAATDVLRLAADCAQTSGGAPAGQTLIQLLGTTRVLKALKATTCYVTDVVWPLATELATQSPLSTLSTQPDLQLRSETGARDMGSTLLSNATRVLTFVLTHSAGPGMRRVLPALEESGLLQALSTALLKAPPVVPVGRPVLCLPDTKPVPASAFADRMATVQAELCLNSLKLLSDDFTARGKEAAAAPKLLSTPELLALRRELLRQVALYGERSYDMVLSLEPRSTSAPPAGPAASAAASSTGGSSEGSDEDEEQGPGTDQPMRATVQLSEPVWALLHSPIRFSFPAISGLPDLAPILTRMVEGVIGPVVLVSQAVKAEATGMVLAARAVEQLYPSRAEFADVAARAAKALAKNVSNSPGLVEGVSSGLREMVEMRMRGASAAEVHECMPALLELHAHSLSVMAAAEVPIEDVLDAVKMLGARLQGVEQPPTAPPRRVRTAAADGKIMALPPAVLQSCVDSLLPTGLAPSLDALVRRLAASGQAEAAALSMRASLGGLLGPLLCARLLGWRERVLERARADSGAEWGAAPAGPPAEEGGVEVVLPLGDEAEDLPSVQGELGLLVSMAKMMRAEAARRRAGQQPSGTPELLEEESAWYALALTSCIIACSPGGLPDTLPQLVLPSEREEGVTPEAWAAAERRLDAGRLAVWEAMCLCGTAAMQLTTHQLKAAYDKLRRSSAAQREQLLKPSTGQAGAPSPLFRLGARLASTAACVVASSATYLLPEALMAAAPQETIRVAALLGAEMLHVEDASSRRGGWAAHGDATARSATFAFNKVLEGLGCAVIFLSANEQLQRACVPGWLWGTGRKDAEWALEGGAQPNDVFFDVTTMSDMTSVFAPPPRPVVQLYTPSANGRALDGKRWAQHERHAAAVRALAMEWADQRSPVRMGPWHALMETAAAVRSERQGGGQGSGLTGGAQGQGGGGGHVWAPWLLRVCGNPGCEVWGEGGEVDLPLKRCSGCRTVRYCGRACQQAHWRGGHKEECGALAAAATAARPTKE
ncbi:hypothetical protein HYH03_004239 [Edaphochlamys debaryana]|uniref:MYND-type domain-containing protein n=1 Tax=Edaphochlamys debaryana TaxID=47281 RepID=A0A836C2N8_9CHLO|nr:hypothetical protein HYH03_004239 [Edaphochlamys debaryana]|eukprot:KAG2497980.1 hypothetical protein HYH03_004239 [Edaphochlamys debaryana]